MQLINFTGWVSKVLFNGIQTRISIKRMVLATVFIPGILFTGTFATGTLFAQTELKPKLTVNGGVEVRMGPNQPAVWEISIDKQVDGESSVLDDFETAHKKYMHMVVIKKDLSHFAHFHPTFDPSTGLFTTPVNLPVLNPDNQDIPRAVPTPGDYFIFAEAKSKDFGMLTFRFDLKASGKPQYQGIVSDPTYDDLGSILKHLNAAGQIIQENGKFLVKLSRQQVLGAGGELVQFDFEVKILLAESGEYLPIEKLQPWLMMGGHAIITGIQGEVASEKLFGHLHAQTPESGGKLQFSYFNRGAMINGLNRIWIQYKFEDQVFTVPFTFDYLSLIE